MTLISSRKRLVVCLAPFLSVLTGWAEDFSVINRDTASLESISFLDALGGRGIAEISPTDTVSVQGLVFLDDQAGQPLRCASLQIGGGPDNKRGGGLFLRKTELQVDGDITLSPAPGALADLHVEWLASLGWTGRLEVVGAGGVLAWAGGRSLNGGSLVLQGGTVRFKVQTRGVMDRFFTPNRSALITLDGEFSADAEAVVQILLQQEAEGASLPAGEFVLVRSERTTGALPRLVVVGAPEDQREKMSLKSGDGSLLLVVEGAN